MPRHSVAERASAVCTSVRGPSLYAGSACGARLREAGVFNTTVTAFAVGLKRWTATGTQGAALTEAPWDLNFGDNLCTTHNTHTADATGGAVIVQASIGAAIGSAMIWTFGDSGVVIPEGTSNGIGFFLPTGTGQIFDFYFIWDE